MHITQDIRYIGVNDHEIDLFEGQYIVPNGMAYNSYLILDEKPAVMDAVDSRFVDQWLSNLEKALEGKVLYYPTYGAGSQRRRGCVFGQVSGGDPRLLQKGCAYDRPVLWRQLC